MSYRVGRRLCALALNGYYYSTVEKICQGFFSKKCKFSQFFSEIEKGAAMSGKRARKRAERKEKSPNTKTVYGLKTVKPKKGLFEVELLLELINSTARINKLLFSGEERMALRANIDAQIVLGRSGHESLTASALNRYFLVFGMKIFLHDYPPLPI